IVRNDLVELLEDERAQVQRIAACLKFGACAGELIGRGRGAGYLDAAIGHEFGHGPELGTLFIASRTSNKYRQTSVCVFQIAVCQGQGLKKLGHGWLRRYSSSAASSRSA